MRARGSTSGRQTTSGKVCAAFLLVCFVLALDFFFFFFFSLFVLGFPLLPGEGAARCPPLSGSSWGPPTGSGFQVCGGLRGPDPGPACKSFWLEPGTWGSHLVSDRVNCGLLFPLFLFVWNLNKETIWGKKKSPPPAGLWRERTWEDMTRVIKISLARVKEIILYLLVLFCLVDQTTVY